MFSKLVQHRVIWVHSQRQEVLEEYNILLHKVLLNSEPIITLIRTFGDFLSPSSQVNATGTRSGVSSERDNL